MEKAPESDGLALEAVAGAFFCDLRWSFPGDWHIIGHFGLNDTGRAGRVIRI
jgi:hypothetical protein